MKTLTLTDYEAELLALLLKRAAEEFGRHGCNDFNVEQELKLSKAYAVVFARALRVKMAETGVTDASYPKEARGPYLMDWMLFHLFQRMVERA